MEATIDSALRRIETTEEVRVLYAVESGSRGWGVASSTSDWDVRFIYLRPPAWYLSIQPRRDVLDFPLEGALDVRGWDLKKGLGLFAKSNPPLLEWLRSPIVYREASGAIPMLRALAPQYFSPCTCGHHYLRMGEARFRDCQGAATVGLKKYFYALRPVLACRWIEAHDSLPPIPFADLVADQLPPSLHPTVDDLLDRKRAGAERAAGPRLPELDGFLADEITRLQTALPAFHQPHAPDLERLDQVFRDSLNEVWGTGPEAVA